MQALPGVCGHCVAVAWLAAWPIAFDCCGSGPFVGLCVGLYGLGDKWPWRGRIALVGAL